MYRADKVQQTLIFFVSFQTEPAVFARGAPAGQGPQLLRQLDRGMPRAGNNRRNERERTGKDYYVHTRLLVDGTFYCTIVLWDIYWL